MYTVYTHQLIITATDEDGKTYRKNLELTFSTKETSVEIGMLDNSSNGLAKLSKDGDHLVLTTSSDGCCRLWVERKRMGTNGGRYRRDIKQKF